MNIQELEKLAIWYGEHFDNLSQLYQGLIAPIQNNNQQQSKLPVEGPMNTLVQFADAMNLEVLSLQQLKVLETIGVLRYIGRSGGMFIQDTIKTANYDPATALVALNEAFNSISSTKVKFEAYLQSLNGLELQHAEVPGSDRYITIRIGFQNDASIDNVTQWKDSAKDWFDIIRGISVAANEAPESTRVLGASSGSIILVLASVAAVTALLAKISKHVIGVAKDVLEIRHSMEDLRNKKILTTIMATEFDALIRTRKSGALTTILDEIKPLLPDESGDKIPALTASIKKLLEFNEKGGNVDFVAPDAAHTNAENAEDGESDATTRSAITSVREAIHEYQEMREEIKLLAHGVSGV